VYLVIKPCLSHNPQLIEVCVYSFSILFVGTSRPEDIVTEHTSCHPSGVTEYARPVPRSLDHYGAFPCQLSHGYRRRQKALEVGAAVLPPLPPYPDSSETNTFTSTSHHLSFHSLPSIQRPCTKKIYKHTLTENACRTYRRQPQLRRDVRIFLFPAPICPNVDIGLVGTHRRRGWTRNFTLAPDAVTNIDYSTLETLLELPTLRVRATRLRVFVEHPPNSNTYVQIRPWREDGSLQAALLRTFFTDRMSAGIVTVLDVRDATEDDVQEEKQLPVSRPERAREWLRTRTLGGVRNSTVSSVTQTDSMIDGSAPMDDVRSYKGQRYRQ
jgi:hypothetical protein